MCADLKAEGFTFTDIKRQGFSVADLTAAGFSAADGSKDQEVFTASSNGDAKKVQTLLDLGADPEGYKVSESVSQSVIGREGRGTTNPRWLDRLPGVLSRPKQRNEKDPKWKDLIW